MAEIRTIPEKISASGIKDTSIDAIGKFSKKVIHHNAGPPTAADDTGLGYAVGSIWVDSTNGDMYTAADVTAEDANWKNMEGDEVNPPFFVQGSTSGFSFARVDAPGHHSTIDKFSLTSDGNATDQGESVNLSKANAGSMRDDNHIYHTGGYGGPAGPGSAQNIYRFATSSPHVSADVGEHSQPAAGGQSASSTSGDAGFSAGIRTISPDATVNHIEKTTFGSPAPSADTSAELSVSRDAAMGVSDNTNGYGFAMGGDIHPSPAEKDVVDRYAFVSTATATDWGNLTVGRKSGAGTCSKTLGQFGGGRSAADNYTNVIDSFPFSSPGDSTDWGDLLLAKSDFTGCQSTTSGYDSGGDASPGQINTIEKWSNSSPANSTDVGESSDLHQNGTMSEV